MSGSKRVDRGQTAGARPTSNDGAKTEEAEYLMKFLFVTDDRLCITRDGRAHTVLPHPYDCLPQPMPDITEFVVWSRRVWWPESRQTSNLFLCPTQVGRCGLRFVGPLRHRFKVSDWPMLLMRSLVALRREVRRADVVFLRTPNIFPLLAHRFARKDQIVVAQQVGNPRETIPIMLPKLKWIAPIMEKHCRSIARRADLVSFVSRALLEEYGKESDNAIITNVCTIRRDQIVKQRRAEVGRPPVVVFVGRLSLEKGVMVLLKAFALVKERKDARLDVIGQGPMRGEMEKTAERLGIGGSVAFHGHISHGEPFFTALGRADTLVLPSFSEGMPSVIVEAMSQGLPVVASKVGGVPDILQDGEAGILVPPGDPRALADGILQSLTDKTLRKRLVAKSLDQALESCVENNYGKLAAEITALIRRQSRDGSSKDR